MGGVKSQLGSPGIPRAGAVLAGKYRVERIIGEGGMGIVLGAYHQFLDQRVAVKLLSAELGNAPEMMTRFLNEARLAARIKSEHVCRVMDMGQLEDGRPYIAMELLQGGDLGALLLMRGPLPVAEAVDYVLQALDALAEAHAGGIVHRDLKPSNLFLAVQGEGRSTVKILDFGISKADDALGGSGSITASRSIVGSPTYMSPEQMKNSKKVDYRTDIWGIGVILYELLTVRVPFDGETPGEIFANILEHPPAPVRERRPDVPEALEAVITRCLRRDRDERFADVGELAEALAPFAMSSRAPTLERIRSQAAKARMRAGTVRPPASSASFPDVPSAPVQAVPPMTRTAPMDIGASGRAATAASWAGSGRSPVARSGSTKLIFAAAFGLTALVGLGVFGMSRVVAARRHAHAGTASTTIATSTSTTTTTTTTTTTATDPAAEASASASSSASAKPASVATTRPAATQDKRSILRQRN
jgi:serine/threonine-protein kinase